MSEVAILKSFWTRRPDGQWAIEGLKGVPLNPKVGEQDAHLFEIDNDIFLVQGILPSTVHAFLGESIVPIVARRDGDTLLRCIGTGFFISCSGLLVTATHVITDPIDRNYARITEISDKVITSSGIQFGVLIPTNPLFERRAYILHPFEWAYFLADRRDNPIYVKGLDLKASTDVAICKVAPRMNGRAHQPLAIIQAGVKGNGIVVGSQVAAVGYGGMQDVDLVVNEHGELIDDLQLRLKPYVSEGNITAYYSDNFTLKSVSTPGPCFEFSAKIPGGMSGGPIFDGEGIYAHGVVSKSWDGEKISFGSMLSPSMLLQIPQLGNQTIIDLQRSRTHGMPIFSGPQI